MSAGITSLELSLEAQGPIENFGQTSAFHLLEALEDLNDGDLALMHAKLTQQKPLPKPMPAATAGSRSRKPAAAARPARPAPPVRRVSTSPSPPPSPPSGRGGRGGRGRGVARGAPASRGGAGKQPIEGSARAEGARGRGGDRGRRRGGDRGRGGERGGRGGRDGASGAENKRPVSKPLFPKPLRPPGNIWKLTFAEIMRSDTMLGEIVHRIYMVEKAKLDAEVAAKKAADERQRQKELAEKLLEQKRKEAEARERAKFVTPAATSAPTETETEKKEKEEGGEDKKKRRRQGKKPAADVAKAAPDVSNVKAEEKLDVGQYLADLKRRLESGELTKYEYDEQAKAIASATQEPEPSKEAQRPNYFIGVRCKTQEVRDAAAELQKRAVGLCEELADSVVPTQRLHVTLVMLPLHTPEAVKQATKLMHDSVQALVKEHYPEGNMRLTFDRVGHFTNRVLWIGAAADDDREKFLAFRGALEKLFVEAKLATEDDEYKIHGTLIKGNTRIPDSVVEELACAACGTETFDFVELMQVGKYDRAGNYTVAQSCNVRPMTEEEERNAIGEYIYATIAEENAADAGKITGMILDSASVVELRALRSDAAQLRERVVEGRSVLHHAEEEAAAAAKQRSRADDTASVVSEMSEAARSDMRSDAPGFDAGSKEVNYDEYLSALCAKDGLPAWLRLQVPRRAGEARSVYPGHDDLEFAVSRPLPQWPTSFRGAPVRVPSRYPFVSKVQTTYTEDSMRRPRPPLVVE